MADTLLSGSVVLICQRTLPVHTEAYDLVNDQVIDQVRSERETVLVYCQIPRSRKDILEQLGLVNHTLNFRKHLLPIIVDGLIVKTLPDKPRSSKQRYVITEKSKSLHLELVRPETAL